MPENTGHKTYITVDSDNGMRLDRLVRKLNPGTPQGLVEKLLRKGAIRVDGKRAKSAQKVTTGQEIKLPASVKEISKTERTVHLFEPGEAEARLAAMIILERPEFMVLNKPAGLATQGGTNVKESVDSILQVVSSKLAPRDALRLVHRLDQDTSGILLVAKGEAAARELAEAFRSRSMTKTYLALAYKVPHPMEGSIDARLLDEATAKKTPEYDGPPLHKVIVHDEFGKKAITHYKVLDFAKDAYSLLELQPDTGRKHQLRAHLETIGHPILGDGKYGDRNHLPKYLTNTLFLHASRLRHPELFGKQLDVSAPLPPHFESAVDHLGLSLRG